ncbi:MAG: Grx4 family monothiol glutaredoxin [Myxococcales bacterium]|nr:Grx4 family monothiol glutaredoxin [Myxococcales bacterium]
MDSATETRIRQLIDGNKVMLFMKGTRHFPQCGFSGAVIQCLNSVGARYETFNVLSDPAIREGVKEFAQWPTIPQLYINGQFVGGCDIVRELTAKGELSQLVRDADPA